MRRTENRWQHHRAPIEVRVPTEGEPHRITWRAGRLILRDHDVAAEEVLVALGGEPCLCLLVRDAFRGRIDLRSPSTHPPRSPVRVPLGPMFQSGGLIVQAGVPIVSARPGRWQGRSFASLTFPMPGVGRPGDAQRLLQSIQTQPRFQQMPPEAREQLLTHLRYQVLMEIVPGPLAELIKDIGQLRLRRRTDFGVPPSSRPDLDRALQKAVESGIKETVRRARADLRSYGVLTIQSWRLKPGEPVQFDGRLGKFGGFVSVSLPAKWLNRVWLRGLAEVQGYFVLEVDAPAPATFLRGRAVRWLRRAGGDSVPEVADCFLHLQGGQWHLGWC